MQLTAPTSPNRGRLLLSLSQPSRPLTPLERGAGEVEGHLVEFEVEPFEEGEEVAVFGPEVGFGEPAPELFFEDLVGAFHEVVLSPLGWVEVRDEVGVGGVADGVFVDRATVRVDVDLADPVDHGLGGADGDDVAVEEFHGMGRVFLSGL